MWMMASRRSASISTGWGWCHPPPPMCSFLLAVLFKVFLEVVTRRVCCLEACELRYFWPQRFKNTPGGQTLNCAMTGRGESANRLLRFCPRRWPPSRRHVWISSWSHMEVKTLEWQRGHDTPPPQPPPHDPSAFPLRTCYYSGMQARGLEGGGSGCARLAIHQGKGDGDGDKVTTWWWIPRDKELQKRPF